MGETDLMTAISQTGFPIAIATYSLIVLNKSIKENTEATKEMLLMFREMKGNQIKE